MVTEHLRTDWPASGGQWPRVRLPTSHGVHPLNPTTWQTQVSLLGQLDRDSPDSFQEGGTGSPPALGALQLSMLWLTF